MSDPHSYRTNFRELAHAHAAWSDMTFGTPEARGPMGPLGHLAKEIEEALAAPYDGTEYADLLLLVLDASRRAGLSALGLMAQAFDKLEVNMARDWPEAPVDKPVEHIRAPAPGWSKAPEGPGPIRALAEATLAERVQAAMKAEAARGFNVQDEAQIAPLSRGPLGAPAHVVFHVNARGGCIFRALFASHAEAEAYVAGAPEVFPADGIGLPLGAAHPPAEAWAPHGHDE